MKFLPKKTYTYGAIASRAGGIQRLLKVEAKDLEEAIDALLAMKAPEESINTPVKMD